MASLEVWLYMISFVIADFTTHGWSHFYGLPCPSTDSLDPMDYFCTFDVSNIIPKTLFIFHTWLLNPFSRIYVGLTPKIVYIGMCAKGQIFLEFSLMWIWVTCLLAFHMPWDHSYLTFHYPIEALYKEPFGYIEGEELKSKKIILHCCHNLLILDYASLCPLDNLVFFPSLPLLVRFLSIRSRSRWKNKLFIWACRLFLVC